MKVFLYLTFILTSLSALANVETACYHSRKGINKRKKCRRNEKIVAYIANTQNASHICEIRGESLLEYDSIHIYAEGLENKDIVFNHDSYEIAQKQIRSTGLKIIESISPDQVTFHKFDQHQVLNSEIITNLKCVSVNL